MQFLIVFTVTALSHWWCVNLSLGPLYSQYRHSTPYVGPPQQYSVQPPGSGTFYPGPGPGEYPTPYRESLIEYRHTSYCSHTQDTFKIWFHGTVAQSIRLVHQCFPDMCFLIYYFQTPSGTTHLSRPLFLLPFPQPARPTTQDRLCIPPHPPS